MAGAYIDSTGIEMDVKFVQEAVDRLDSRVTELQIDLDSNDYMNEALDWNYSKIRKTVNLLIEQVKELHRDTEQAINEEDDYNSEEDDE